MQLCVERENMSVEIAISIHEHIYVKQHVQVFKSLPNDILAETIPHGLYLHSICILCNRE